jgi:hypothetical protein
MLRVCLFLIHTGLKILQPATGTADSVMAARSLDRISNIDLVPLCR